MGNEILKILNANSSVILIGCFVLLIIITIMELQKTKKMQQSLTYLTKKLADYLAVVFDEEEEQTEKESQKNTVPSRQEVQMRESIQKKQEQKYQGQAGLMDAVLSEIFP